MTKTSKPLIFFGNERLATGVSTIAPVLGALISNGYAVEAVVSNYSTNQVGNNRSLEVAEVAKKHNLPLLLPTKLKEIKEQLIGYSAPIGILVAYGKIVPEEIIDIFPSGIINIHPSLLPLHRGPTPIESAILGGDKKTGVSIMQLAKDMDAGPVYGQTELELVGDESKQSLANTLLDAGRAILLELLPGILNGSVVALPQDNSRATYDGMISKKDGLIDWQKPASELEREVRAFQEWPKSQARLGYQEVIITKAKVTSVAGEPGSIKIDGKRLVVCCREQALEILELKPAGKPAMNAGAFLAGYRQRLA